MPQLSPTPGLMIFLSVFVCFYLLMCFFSTKNITFKSFPFVKNKMKSFKFF